MKKIISIVVLSLGFCLTANAQNEKIMVAADNKVEVVSLEKSIQDIEELDKTVTLSAQLKNDFVTIMKLRTEAIANAKGNEEIQNIYDGYGKKLLSGLSQEQLVKLKANAALYKKLTSFSSEK